MPSDFYKNEPSDRIWWVDNIEEVGVFEFSFDKKTVLNLFQDYPWKLTAEQKLALQKKRILFISSQPSGSRLNKKVATDTDEKWYFVCRCIK